MSPLRNAVAIVSIVVAAILSLSNFIAASAEKPAQPPRADSPYDLINAVNALRAAYGLPAYGINATLMAVAQSHADFMAASGTVTHTGTGGSSVTDRLLAAGYPLAGDLSLGGFRSENITGGAESKTAQEAVNGWTGDALHLNTMISPNLSEIGAGVAVSNGRVYYVIDCALPTANGAPQSVASVSGPGSAVPVNEPTAQAIPIVVVSTPNQAGDVIHEVLPGHTLWQIANAYGVSVDEIKALNNLIDNSIFPGERLLVRKVHLPATATLTPDATSMPALTPSAAATSLQLPATASAIPGAGDAGSKQSIMWTAIAIIALALLGGGILARASAAGEGPR